MKKYTFTWIARFPLNRRCPERRCRWTIYSVETYLKFLLPSERVGFSFFGTSCWNFRLTRSGRLIARSATYEGV